MEKRKTAALTTPDLVLLSLLAERPMHGYEANAELSRRQVRDWAGVSRPQIYYSLEKLAGLGMIRSKDSAQPAQGPERRIFTTTAVGRLALSKALERKEWTTQRERPPFLTWMALSWLAPPEVVRKQLQRRSEYVKKQLKHERATLQSVMAEVEHVHHEAVWMLELVIEQLDTELCWANRIEKQLHFRAPAKHPPFVKLHSVLHPPRSSSTEHR